MSRLPLRRIALCAALSLSFCAAQAQDQAKPVINDLMYPPLPAAKPFIDIDGAGFTVKGQRTYLSSGSIHYARLPHEQWADRLLRLKRGSFAAVQTYAFWDFHEAVEGQWNFSGDHDLGAFLDTAQQMSLYATVRVGPYVCAEWDSGGYPVWLRFKPPFNLRTNDPAWLAWNDHWYDKVLPIVVSHQVSHGGNVVMLQLENEHPRYWGVVKGDPYFDHLRDDAVHAGIDIPFFMSGQHHGGDPKPENLDTTKRTDPWISTEFWSGWFDDYRTLTDKKNREIDNANWTILAHGGGGHNFYMLYGGSNFDTWSDDSTGASYDYGAAIGQAGDLRPAYYKMKRDNQLAASFPEILGNSDDALGRYKDFATGEHVQVLGARVGRGGVGTLVFVQNASGSAATAKLKSGEALYLARFSVAPLPVETAIGDGEKIVVSTLPVLAVAHNDHIATMVFYGQPGESGKLELSAAEPMQIAAGCKTFAPALAKPQEMSLTLNVPQNGVAECELAGAANSLRVLVMSKDLSLYTWLVGDKGAQDVVVGPAFVQEVSHAGGGASAVIERPYGLPSPGQVAIYGARGHLEHVAAKADSTLEGRPAPAVVKWTMAATTEAAPGYNDTAWKHDAAPLPMGADGDYGAFAWYRATVEVPAAGTGTLHLQGADNLEVFVNGQHVANTKGTAQAAFRAGSNSIAVFTSHNGRDKLYNYLGSLPEKDRKGLFGAATLELAGSTIEIKNWAMRGGVVADMDAVRAWQPVAPTQSMPAFYRTTFQAAPPAAMGAHPILRVGYAGLSRGMIWVNGHALGRYPEKIRIDSLYIPEPWLKANGENTLTIFDETGADPSGVRLTIEQQASREVLRTGAAVAAATPFIVPQEDPARDLDALNRGNLAYRRPATASVSAPNSMPGAATDGDPDTEWSAPEKSVNPSLTVDLQKAATIAVCEILWDHPAKYSQYTVEGSTDGITWSKLGDEKTAVPTSPDSPSTLSRLNLAKQSVRYVRVTIRTSWGQSLAEVRVFGK